MQTAPAFAQSRPGTFFKRAEAWLDARGRVAWIVAMILGFVFFWPVGLAFLIYMTMDGKWSLGRASRNPVMRRAMGGTGNAAFDSYKDATLRRLEEEQRAFEEFLQRLREAKDKAEFDEFMDEQSRREAGDEATTDSRA